MNIRRRIILLVVLTFSAITAIGGYAILQLQTNASSVKTLTEGVVPATLAAADLVATIKDVQLTTVAMVFASDQHLVKQAAEKLKRQKGQILASIEAQGGNADNDTQQGLLKQTQGSLNNYFDSIDETTALMLAGQKALSEATLFANVAEYQSELNSIVETLRVEKNRSKDAAILGVNERLSRSVSTISLVTLLAALAQGLMGSLLFLQITRPVRRIQEEIATIRQSLDLSRRIPISGTNEMDQVASGLNALFAEFQDIVRGVQNSGNNVSSKSDELSYSVEQLLIAIEQQNEATTSMAASVEEVAVSVSLVSDSSATAQDIAQKSLTRAKDGGEAIEKSVSEMVAMADDVQLTSRAMEDLGRRSVEIGSIAVTIKEIAEQTSLLALNAAIEVARAGEQGRGFAVVADEVRKLAERTSLATKEIATVIGAIQEETRTAVADMHRMSSLVVTNADGARRAGETIGHIREGSLRVVEVASEMAVALKEQSSATEQIATQIEKVSSMSEKNTTEMAEAKAVATELKCLSAEMHDLVARFRV
jgi:methyl-accepting chemotaxis protein